MKTGTKQNFPYFQVSERALSPAEIVLNNEFDGIIAMLADKRSIPALINLLDDDESYIRWIAAESLVRIGRRSMFPLLRSIENGRQFVFPAKPFYVLQSLMNRREKKEMNHLLLCLEKTESPTEIY
ncbi:MAG TPA: HEAT repeat domain-containing protein [Bacteroidales bacterium]|nr:HEAT repeat domain-containing protein [Bacteroidales bacterium]